MNDTNVGTPEQVPTVARPDNPFRLRAERARASATRLSGPTSHDRAMANAFPLGAGFGRRGSAKRIDATVSRAVAWQKADAKARHLGAMADAYDRGEVDAQGRRSTPASRARSEKAATAKEKRAARIADAKARIEGRDPAEVSPEDWATAHGYLSGSGRDLVMADHRERYAGSVSNIPTPPPAAPGHSEEGV